MKDKRLTDLEDKIKNDLKEGAFNLGDATDPNSIIGMAMSFLRDPKPTNETTGVTEPQKALEGTWLRFFKLGGNGVMKCKCGCWEGKICTFDENTRGICKINKGANK